MTLTFAPVEGLAAPGRMRTIHADAVWGSGGETMKVRNGLFGLLVTAVVVLGLGAAASGAAPDHAISGSLQGTNVMGGSPTYAFNESGTMTLRLSPGQTLKGAYTLNYNRIGGGGPTDTAVGVFGFSVKGATLTGAIWSTDYAGCSILPGALLCMDTVIGPLTVTGKGPLTTLAGGTLTLRRDMFGGGTARTVIGTVEGTRCGPGSTC